MKELNVDLDLLVESFTLDKEGVCEEYLDTITGNIINIPEEVRKAVQGEIEVEDLEEWQRLLVEDAELVFSDEEARFINLPTIKSSLLYKIMIDFTENMMADKEAKDKLDTALRKMQPMAAFKSEIYNYPALIDLWHDYEEEKLKEYIINWLLENKITLI